MNNKIALLGFIFMLTWLLWPQSTVAQQCDLTIPLDTWKVDGVDDNIQPGDIICLQSGTRGTLRLEDLVGTPEEPIIIQNSGGKLVIDTDYSIAVAQSQYLRLTGWGSPDHDYGIEAAGTVYIGGLTSNVEVDHLESCYLFTLDPKIGAYRQKVEEKVEENPLLSHPSIVVLNHLRSPKSLAGFFVSINHEFKRIERIKR